MLHLGEYSIFELKMNNVVFIDFYKKNNFPKGAWLKEPDLCFWENSLPCLALRDMELGTWKGFVGVDETHPLFNKNINELMQNLKLYASVYGGLTEAGKVLVKNKVFLKNYWWIGFETTHGGDLIPLLKLDESNADLMKLIGNQSYKDFKFIRKEINKLENFISKLK